MAERIQIECTFCNAISTVRRPRKTVSIRCGRCGSDRVREVTVDFLSEDFRARKADGGKSLILEPRVEAPLKAKWVCVECLNEWVYEYAPNITPTCPECSSVDVNPITPAAAFFSKTNENLTLAQQKRFRFIRREWKNYKRLERHIDSMLQLLKRLNIPEKIYLGTEVQLKDCIKVLDLRHAEVLQQFDELAGVQTDRITKVTVISEPGGLRIQWSALGEYVGYNVFRCVGLWIEEKAERVNKVLLKESELFDGPGNMLRVAESEVQYPRGSVCYRVEGIKRC